MTYTTELGSENTHFTLGTTQSYIVIQYRQHMPQFYRVLGALFLLYLN